MTQEEYEAGLALYEIRGITYETSGAAVQKTGGRLRKIRWSGMTTAKFESSRKWIKSEGAWSEWVKGGAYSSYYEFAEGNWLHRPVRQEFSTCIDVALFTGKAGIGKPLPEEMLKAPLRSISGETFTLAHYKGPVLVYLWATWCGPCRVQEPELIEIQNKYREKGLTIIGLNVDAEKKEMIDAYIKRMQINYITATGDPELTSAFMKLSRVFAIPQTFLLYNGKLIGVTKGYSPAARANIEKMLEPIVNDRAK